MRATISFEADVSRVNDIMRSLVLEESNALQDALIALEKATADRIVEGISEALEHIQGVATQLEQYRQMMVSFERARFETILPQPADSIPDVVVDDDIAGPMAEATQEAAETAQQMKQFNDFLSRIRDEATSRAEEVAREERDQDAPPKR